MDNKNQGPNQESKTLKNEIFEYEPMTAALSKLFQSSDLPTEVMFKISSFVLEYEKAQKAYSQTKQKLIQKYADIDPATNKPVKVINPQGQAQYTVRKNAQEYAQEMDKLLEQEALEWPNIKIEYDKLPKDLKVPLILAQLRKVLDIEDK